MTFGFPPVPFKAHAARRHRTPRQRHRVTNWAEYAGVSGTGTGWPDLVVAAAMAALGVSGGWQITRQAMAELRGTPAVAPAHVVQP